MLTIFDGFECFLNTSMNPEDLLMQLKIETCYRSAPSLCSEVYKMPDGTGRLYWLYELESSRLLQLCRDFRIKYDLPLKMSISNIFKHPCFVEEYRKINPVKRISVPIEEMSIIYRIINKGLPKDVHYPSGLDGHKYYLKTYGKLKQEYQAWMEIPKEWGTFAELITTMIRIAGWTRKYNCRIEKQIIRKEAQP